MDACQSLQRIELVLNLAVKLLGRVDSMYRCKIFHAPWHADLFAVTYYAHHWELQPFQRAARNAGTLMNDLKFLPYSFWIRFRAAECAARADDSSIPKFVLPSGAGGLSLCGQIKLQRSLKGQWPASKPGEEWGEQPWGACTVRERVSASQLCHTREAPHHGSRSQQLM